MTYSYTQISQYLTCPRRYRHRYLDGWKEKDTRAAMLFGRAFEQPWAPSFAGKIPEPCCSPSGLPARARTCTIPTATPGIACSGKDIMLLTRFCQDDRVQVHQPQRNLQIKFTRQVAGNNDFVAYIDAIGKLDGKRCLLEWKTSSSRYPEQPEGLLSLDPQLVCYSWITGIADVAQVVFVRKSMVEVQYLRTTITEEQRLEFGQPGRRHDPPHRVGRLPGTQWHPLSPEPLQHLSVCGPVSWQAGNDRRRRGAASRSRPS